jgi:hypothetical protein
MHAASESFLCWVPVKAVSRVEGGGLWHVGLFPYLGARNVCRQRTPAKLAICLCV